ncbi:MAG: DNA ligase [Planctomycetes bacterium]|nr:DNA ligase [Planctomycetota bacterium]
MGRPLDDYRKKRDFARTSEPPGKSRRGRPRGGADGESEDAGGERRAFVVHRHEARRLHYDLRLQMEGVLRSWAVPKGFSYEPRDKHLAVRTEDHPLEYESFSGMIPPGEYGAGAMTIWDSGHYALVTDGTPAAAVAEGELKLLLFGRRLRGEWHLVRTQGGPERRRGGEGGEHWLLFKSKDRYAGTTRDSALGIDLARAPLSTPPARQGVMRAGAAGAPFSDPDWLFEMRFRGRRALAQVDAGGTRLRGLRGAPDEVLSDLREVRATSALLDGVLVALDEGQRPSEERLAARLAGDASIEVCYYAFDLLFADGFDLRGLPLVERKSALRTVLRELPGCVLFVDHVTGDGLRLAEAVRAAGLPGLVAKRLDAPYVPGASDAWRRIDLDASPETPRVTDALEARTPRARARRGKVAFTNLDKVFWPAEGYTKGDLVAFYDGVADVLLPYLRDRPCHMNRFPDGIEGKSFYQRQANESIPDWVPTVTVPSGSRDEPHRHMLINGRDALLLLANLGSIDLHPWLSRAQHLGHPDFSVLDLDPKGAPFSDVVRIARSLGKILRGIGLRPLLKTSGKTGLHIYVPLLEDAYTYDQARMFCESIARVVARDHKDIATCERVVDSRGGRVYIDFGQNRAGQTVVPPYSVRPVPGATVSTPLMWDELEGELHPSMFTIRTVPERLQRHGDLFRGALADRQDLVPAIEALDRYLASR